MSRTGTAALLTGWFSIALLSGCLAALESAQPLTPEARAVTLAPGTQDATLLLADACERRGRIETVWSEHFARLRSAEQNSNVAQVLSVETMNGRTHRLNVRFWFCPGAVIARLPR